MTRMLSRICDRAGQAVASFRQANGGVVAVEFAFVGMPFLLLITCIMVVGFMLYCSATLDYATQKAARAIMTGNVQSSGLTASQFQTQQICQYLPSAIFTCSKVVVNLTDFVKTSQVYTQNNYYQFVNTTQTALIMPSLTSSSPPYCTGSANSYEVLEVLYPMPIYLSLFSTSPQVVNGQFVLMSTATFKNEPFTGGASSGC